MDILLFLTGLIALGGLWLVVDFLHWYFSGHVVPGTITGFDKGLPIVSFVTTDGKKKNMKASKIAHLGYLLVAPIEGDIFNVIYRETDDDVIVHVYGFLYLIAGVATLLPFLGVLAFKYSKVWMMSQLSFLLVLVVIVMGGWILMKLIGRSR